MPIEDRQRTAGYCPPKTRKRKPTDADKLDAAFDILSTAVKKGNPVEPNECQLFGNLVATKLQKYSSSAQTAVQEAIMQILFQADRGYYNAHSFHISPHVNLYPNSSSTSTPSVNSPHLSYSPSLSPALSPNTQYYPLHSQSPSTTPSPSPAASAEVIQAPNSEHSQFYTNLVPAAAASAESMPETYFTN